MITFGIPKHHWNYYLAIEKDFESLSRYIEFSKPNQNTYSIELAHILLSTCSEVDVVMKQLCALIDPSHPADNIDKYRSIIRANLESIIIEEISINRFGLKSNPWENWREDLNPDWWRSYNNVKHERNNHFNQANLKNTMNAVGALLLTVVYYYKQAFSNEARTPVDFRDTTQQLQPEPSFLRMNEDYYYSHLIG